MISHASVSIPSTKQRKSCTLPAPSIARIKHSVANINTLITSKVIAAKAAERIKLAKKNKEKSQPLPPLTSPNALSVEIIRTIGTNYFAEHTNVLGRIFRVHNRHACAYLLETTQAPEIELQDQSNLKAPYLPESPKLLLWEKLIGFYLAINNPDSSLAEKIEILFVNAFHPRFSNEFYPGIDKGRDSHNIVPYTAREIAENQLMPCVAEKYSPKVATLKEFKNSSLVEYDASIESGVAEQRNTALYSSGNSALQVHSSFSMKITADAIVAALVTPQKTRSLS